jgi:hypothetical protein
MEDSAVSPKGEAEGEQPGMKYLVAAVYIMGVLLVLCFVGLIAAIVWKAVGKKEDVWAAPQVLELGLPAGTTIHNMALERDRLVLNTGPEILVIDTKQNRVVSRIAVTAK